MGVPTRTCIGCRRRTAATELLRLSVVDGRPRARTGRVPVGAPGVRGQVQGIATGRGASIHPTQACLTAAVKTNAFAKAFRRPVLTEEAAFRSLFVDIEVAHGLQQRGAGTP